MAIETRPTQVNLTGRDAPPAVSIDHVSVRLGERTALRDIDCEIWAGSFVGLIGPNGSGKSTLIRAILGIVPLTAGEIRIEGRPIGEARDSFAYLPQRQQIDIDLPLRAHDVVMMGRLRHSGWLRPHSKTDREVAAWALEQVGLADRRNSSIGEMSFGQQQRVFFARMLAQQGSILLLDEPMNGVDSTTQDLFLELLERFHHEGKTVLMATHDLNQAACICDNLCVLRQRLIAYGPVSETLTNEVLHAAYGGHIHFVEDSQAAGHVQVLEDFHHHETDSDRTRGARLA